MPLTLEQAKGLKPGDQLYHMGRKDSRGYPQRWRVSGRVKTWVTRPECVRFPVKYGMYTHATVDESSLHYLTLDESEAL